MRHTDIIVICCIMFALVLLYPGTASAISQTDPITNILCIVINQLKGPAGKAVAVGAMLVLGIGLFMGKISWPVVLATAIGLGLLFGGDTLIQWATGDYTPICPSPK